MRRRRLITAAGALPASVALTRPSLGRASTAATGWGGWVAGIAPRMMGVPRGDALFVFALA
jgi:hypothetical protein